METLLGVRPYSSSEIQSRLQQLLDGTTTSYTAYYTDNRLLISRVSSSTLVWYILWRSTQTWDG